MKRFPQQVIRLNLHDPFNHCCSRRATFESQCRHFHDGMGDVKFQPPPCLYVVPNRKFKLEQMSPPAQLAREATRLQAEARDPPTLTRTTQYTTSTDIQLTIIQTPYFFFQFFFSLPVKIVRKYTNITVDASIDIMLS